MYGIEHRTASVASFGKETRDSRYERTTQSCHYRLFNKHMVDAVILRHARSSLHFDTSMTTQIIETDFAHLVLFLEILRSCNTCSPDGTAALQIRETPRQPW